MKLSMRCESNVVNKKRGSLSCELLLKISTRSAVIGLMDVHPVNAQAQSHHLILPNILRNLLAQ